MGLIFSINSSFAQDASTYLKNFDSKIYSLKTKGVKDFVVEIESTRLTKQVNDMAIFGKVKSLTFKVFWTASPERFSINVIGLPEGFKEIKEDLKKNIFAMLDNLIPIPTEDRYTGYKFSMVNKSKEIQAIDLTNMAAIPSFVFKFDQQDKLREIIGNKPIGSLSIKTNYEKKDFSQGKWVLDSIVTINSESGQTVTMKKNLGYGSSQGIAVLSSITIITEQKGDSSESKPEVIEDTVTFSGYKINSGEALTHFLGNPGNLKKK